MIFPISHDESTVRRWPWITLAILVLNVGVFVATHSRMQAEDERASKAAAAALEYYVQHSYLAAPADLRALVPTGPNPAVGRTTSQEDFERIQREVLGRPSSSEAETDMTREQRVRAEQEHLDRLVLGMRSALRNRLIVQYGNTPARYSVLGLVTSQFLHSGWLHLIFNLWFLWLVGCNVEDRWGRVAFPILYLSAGIAAALVYNLMSWGSTVPVIGASGAIAGAMGAFLVRFGRTRIRFAYWLVLRPGTFSAPAYLMLPLWAGKELLEWSLFGRTSAVAHGAHLGGFAYGVVFAFVVAASGLERRLDRMLERKEVVSEQDPELAAAAALADQGRMGEALQALDRLRTSKPNDIDVRLELLRVAHAAGDTGRARLGRVELIGLYLRQGAEDTAVDLYHELVQSGTESSLPSGMRFRIARRLERQGSLVRAEQEYDKLHAGSLEDEAAFQAILAHAALCVRQGRKAAALELYGTAKEAVWAHLLLETTVQQGLRDAQALPDEPPRGPEQQTELEAISHDDAPEIESGEAPALILMNRSEPPETDSPPAALAPSLPAPALAVPTPTLVSAGTSGPAQPIECAAQVATNVPSQPSAEAAPVPAPGAAIPPAGYPHSHKANRPDDAGRYSLRPGSVVEVDLAVTPSGAPRSSARVSVRSSSHVEELGPGSRVPADAGRYSTSTPVVESMSTPRESLRSRSSSGAGHGTRRSTRDDLRPPAPAEPTPGPTDVTRGPRRK
ncbi:MAG: rhomboid family intramembrane serine protease [Polyangiaceae bacterium]|nr:rhomboid family intramembrane serine protease [Polyangiaceae bacterium]